MTAGKTTSKAANTDDGARDFDFLIGSWQVHNRRLRQRLQSSTEWDEFPASNVARQLLGGVGNEDEFRTAHDGGFIGMTFRFFNRATRQWAIYWADSRTGRLEPPVIGSFRGERGVFDGTDVCDGRPVRVRFTWLRLDGDRARWEQAFSADDGRTWETNWIMEMTRQGSAPAPEA
jgi:hypothetical protein